MQLSSRPVVYISGPLSAEGRWLSNIHDAAQVNALLIDSGFAPICPHLLALGQMINPVADDHDYDTWMSVDCAIVGVCDAVVRMPGESKGGDIEVQYAIDNNIPVFYDIFDLEEHFKFNSEE